jgi:F0F1-type ATP synthase assembly protein I
MDPSAPSKKTISSAKDLGRYAGMGVQFAGSIVLLGAVGWWLDGKLDTSPWLLITGVFAGAVGGFIAMLRAVPPARGAKRREDR